MLGQVYDATGRDRALHHSRAREILTDLGVMMPRVAESVDAADDLPAESVAQFSR